MTSTARHDDAGDGANEDLSPGLAERHLHPSLALQPGARDPLALLCLWFLSRTSLPLLVLGMAVGVLLSGQPPDAALDDPGDVARTIASPWAGVAIAVVLRQAARALALVLALPLTSWPRRDDYPAGRIGNLRRWVDRWRRAGAYRAIRWTWPVRRLAAERLGRDARWLQVMDLAWSIAIVVAAVALLLSAVIAAS